MPINNSKTKPLDDTRLDTQADTIPKPLNETSIDTSTVTQPLLPSVTPLITAKL